MIPVRDLSVQMGLYNNVWGLVIFHIAFQTGFCTLFMRNFIKALPFALIESARVEGVSEVKIFWHIILPLMRPAIAALSVLIFTFIWNDYFWATVMIQGKNAMPITGGPAVAEWPVDQRLASGLRRLDRRGAAAGDHVLPDAEALHRRPDAWGDQGMSRIVRIVGPSSALIISVPDRGMPELTYFGPNGIVTDCSLDSIPALLRRFQRVNGMDQQVPHAVWLPAGGMGFFGWPAIAGHRDGRDFIIDPSDWSLDEEESAISLTGQDSVAGVSVHLSARITSTGSLVMASGLTNNRDGDYTLDRCMAGSLALDATQDTITTFEGNWGAEFHMRREPLGSALWIKENRRGRTSHDRFPGVLFEERQSTDFGGTVTGAHLAWSGNHVTAVDRLDDGRKLLHMGELFEPGEMRLAKGERYDSPKMIVVRDWQGLDGVANGFHEHVREHVLPQHVSSMKPRPVILNTWEGNYFKHDVEKLKAQATAAAKLGIERFVLDDGWFGKRDDDTTSLGDWFIDKRKYPDGLKPLIDHVGSLGMEFGLWFEPEMVNPTASLPQAPGLAVAGQGPSADAIAPPAGA